MYIVLYRWRIKPECEDQFIEGWSDVTRFYAEKFDSLGSRLHRGDDGVWYAYAQWESAAHRENAFENIPDLPARDKMRESIAASFPPVELAIEADFLKARPIK